MRTVMLMTILRRSLLLFFISNRSSKQYEYILQSWNAFSYSYCRLRNITTADWVLKPYKYSTTVSTKLHNHRAQIYVQVEGGSIGKWAYQRTYCILHSFFISRGILIVPLTHGAIDKLFIRTDVKGMSYVPHVLWSVWQFKAHSCWLHDISHYLCIHL